MKYSSTVASLILVIGVIGHGCVGVIAGAVGGIPSQVTEATEEMAVTEQQANQFLDAHNYLRGQVSPAASNMEKMIYNADLASMAQEWADGCEYKHGNPTRTPPPFPVIGQNLYISTAAAHPANATQAWYDEVNFYTYSSTECSDVCGHYTQVVWATSSAVGCGIAHCTPLADWPSGYMIVCNYGPAGNYKGEKPYAEGTHCASCPADNICESNLCVDPTKNYTVPEAGTVNGGALNTTNTAVPGDDENGLSGCEGTRATVVNAVLGTLIISLLLR